MSRGGGEIKPLWQRIFASALLMALFGWLLGLIYGPDEPLLTAIISGAFLRSARSASAEGAGRAGRRRRSGGSLPSSRCGCRVCAGGCGGGGRVSRGRRDRLPQPAAGPCDGRGGAGGGAAIRRALRGAFALRRRRLRGAAREGPGRDLPSQSARRGNSRVARQLDRADLRGGPGAPADPGVLRAHQPVQALHRSGVAALDEARGTSSSSCWSRSRWGRPRFRPTSRKPSAG